MARQRNKKLTAAAVRIGSTMGKADRRARSIVNRVRSARKELRHDLLELSKTADRLSRDLKRANKQLRHALG
jgi:hypothetical protein